MSRRSLDLTLGFLKTLDRSVSVDDVHFVLDKYLSQFGISKYLAGAVFGPNARPREQLNQALLDTMPDEWKRRYMTQGYLRKDPTIPLLGVMREPFSWAEAMERAGNDTGARRVLLEAGDFGMEQGFTVPLMTLDGDIAGFSFSGVRVELSPAERSTLHMVATYAFAQLLLIRSSSLGLEAVTLAPREREALQWAAEGKTAWEIGRVMGISVKGVEHHLRTVRSKLGAVNSTQSVAIALRYALIS